MLPTRSIAPCGAGHRDTSVPPGHCLLHRGRAAHRDDARKFHQHAVASGLPGDESADIRLARRRSAQEELKLRNLRAMPTTAWRRLRLSDQVRSGLFAGGNWIRTIGPSPTTGTPEDLGTCTAE